MDGMTPCERGKGRAEKIAGFAVWRERFVEKEACEGPLGRLSCMWSQVTYFGVRGTTGE